MESQFQPSSFIPKKSGDSSSDDNRKRGGRSLASMIGIAIFVISLLLAGGVFGFEKFKEGQLADKKQTLAEAKSAFEPELIEELVRLDSRFNIAENILNEHVAVTPFFSLLEERTLQSVQFTSFSFNRSENEVRVEMNGITDSFPSVALQSDLFGEERAIHNPIFSDFVVEDTGDVTFHVSFGVDPSLLSYRNQIAAEQTTEQPEGSEIQQEDGVQESDGAEATTSAQVEQSSVAGEDPDDDGSSSLNTAEAGTSENEDESGDVEVEDNVPPPPPPPEPSGQ